MAKLKTVAAAMHAVRVGAFSVEEILEMGDDDLLEKIIKPYSEPNRIDAEFRNEIRSIFSRPRAGNAQAAIPVGTRPVAAGRARARQSAGGPRRATNTSSASGDSGDSGEPDPPGDHARGIRRHDVEPFLTAARIAGEQGTKDDRSASGTGPRRMIRSGQVATRA